MEAGGERRSARSVLAVRHDDDDDDDETINGTITDTINTVLGGPGSSDNEEIFYILQISGNRASLSWTTVFLVGVSYPNPQLGIHSADPKPHLQGV